jgi:hypothetical protein
MPDYATPSVDNEVYGVDVEKGELEVEAKFDTLAGGPEDGKNVIKLEAAYGVTDRLRLAPFVKFEKMPGKSREAKEVGIEAIYELGSVGVIDFVLYGKYAFGLNGHAGEIEIARAASVDIEAFHEVRLSVQAFGEFGTFNDCTTARGAFLLTRVQG